MKLISKSKLDLGYTAASYGSAMCGSKLQCSCETRFGSKLRRACVRSILRLAKWEHNISHIIKNNKALSVLKSQVYKIWGVIVNSFFTLQIPQPNSQEKWKRTVSQGIKRWSKVLKTCGTCEQRYFQPTSQEKWPRPLFENFLNWDSTRQIIRSHKSNLNIVLSTDVDENYSSHIHTLWGGD